MSLGGDIGSQLIKIVEKVRTDLIANDFATKSYVDEIISSGIISKIVAELPATGEAGIIYMVPVSSELQKDYNVYKEYVYVEGKWEDLGSTELNLEDYPNKTYITDRLADKLTKNDPSIPTKLSDLELDEASKFMSVNIVTSLPALATAKNNEIYMLLYKNEKTYTGSKDVIIPASDFLANTIKITNNGNAAIKVYKTIIGQAEETTASLTVAIGATGSLDIDAKAAQVRINSLSSTMNVRVEWVRDTKYNYIKYIKVNGAWEVLGNPDSVAFDYLRENYYRKGEIYTEADVSASVDALILNLDNAEYDSTIAWENAYKPSVFGSNSFVALAYNRYKYFAYTSDGKVSMSNNLTEWSTFSTCSNIVGMDDVTYSDKYGKLLCVDSGALKASADGINWNTVVGLNTGTARITNSYKTTVALVNKSATSLEVYVTEDGGASGTTVNISITSAHGTYKVLYHDGVQFVAISDKGYVLTSLDGKTWTVPTVAKMHVGTWTDAVYDGRHAVILGSAGEVVYSTDSNKFSELSMERAIGDYSSTWKSMCLGGAYTLAGLSTDGYIGAAHAFI